MWAHGNLLEVEFQTDAGVVSYCVRFKSDDNERILIAQFMMKKRDNSITQSKIGINSAFTWMSPNDWVCFIEWWIVGDGLGLREIGSP